MSRCSPAGCSAALRAPSAYTGDVARFLAFVGRPLQLVTLSDLQTYASTLAHLSPATQARRLASITSLLSKAHTLGSIAFNPGAARAVGTVKNRIGERILTEEQVHRLLVRETDPATMRSCGSCTRLGCAVTSCAADQYRFSVGRAAGVTLISCKESLDTSTPHGQFVLTMVAALAQLEGDTIVERTTAGRT